MTARTEYQDMRYTEDQLEAITHGHPAWSHAVAYGPCTLPSVTDARMPSWYPSSAELQGMRDSLTSAPSLPGYFSVILPSGDWLTHPHVGAWWDERQNGIGR